VGLYVKVLLSAFQCSPGYGSEIGNGWNWAITLSDHGHDVTVLTLPEYRDAIQAADTHGIDFRFIDFPESPLSHFSRQFGWIDRYLRWQDAILRHVEASRERYDVIHHVTWGSLRLGSRLWRREEPLVYGPIGGGQTSPASYWRYLGREWPAERLRAVSGGPLLKLNSRSRDTIRNSAVTLVTNSATAAACQRLGAADVRYMLAEGLPSDWLVEPRQRPSGTPVVLWVGRLLRIKAPTLAIQAFAELRRAMPARLVVAGDGPLREQTRAAIGHLGLTDDVDVLGHVPWNDIRRLYDSASILLFTSLRDSSGAQFLEALGRGLPAVALDHHGIADLDVGTAALKVPLPAEPRDLPGDLASAMQTVLCDSEWEARSAAAVNWAAKHLWPVKAAAASQIYREITEAGASGS
jgi:glycosyltransferase involved in cell wall biosynthesis